MKKKLIFFLFIVSLATSAFSTAYWISRFFASIEFTNTGPVAVLKQLNESDITCDCNVYPINSGYSSFTITSPVRNLFIGNWEIYSEIPYNFKIDIYRSDINNTTSVIGIGYFGNDCNYSFDDLTNITFRYQSKKLCITTYSFGSYEDFYYYNIQNKSVVVFLWIPSVGEKTTISLKSSVYVV